jgi:haloalkane dehalogenase
VSPSAKGIHAFQCWPGRASCRSTASPIPKLFIAGDPGAMLIGPARDFCDTWPRQQKVTVPGIHYLQEDSPTEIGVAIARFIKDLPE